MTHINTGDRTPTEAWVDRLDAFQVAYQAVQGKDFGDVPTFQDVLSLAEFLTDGESTLLIRKVNELTEENTDLSAEVAELEELVESLASDVGEAE